MTKHFIIGREIVLLSHVLTLEPVRITRCAVLPDNSHNGAILWVHYWEINGETAFLRYSMRGDITAPVLSITLPATLEEEALKPPGKRWQWNEGEWFNRTTKERREVK